jgi:DNA polymerase III epsilon subunit-like protein
MLLAILDFEATGTDVQTARITEASVILWDSSQKRIVEASSWLVKPEGYADIDPIVSALTGVSYEFLTKYGTRASVVLPNVHAMCFRADYVVGHNIRRYDIPLFINELARDNPLLEYRFKPIVDTRFDIDYPEHIDTRKLGYLAQEHGIYAPHAHAAMFDCITTLELLKKYDLAEVIYNSTIPRIYVRADVKFEQKDLAKEQKYHWDGASKVWWKEIKQTDYEKEKSKCKFPVIVLKDYKPPT